jgi:2',3'-cyclic-nucleotide 2'-phosphodiesterase (5'-nucleotidase family)
LKLIYFKFAKRDSPTGHWTKAAIAIMNSGGIRGSLEAGNITTADMLGVIPFQNSVDLIQIKGEYLKQTFEFMASKIGEGGFLQVAGN